jgi:TetR/AcrR family transcriptional regulator, cholesterol catabolism regulator
MRERGYVAVSTPLREKKRHFQSERVSKRRRQLAEVTLRLVRERGFDALSVNELAEHASISVGGLYRYIKTKSDLLVLVCDEINRGLNDRMAEAAGAVRGITAKLCAIYSVYWETCWDNALALLLAYREWQSLPDDAKKRYLTQEKQIAGQFRDLIRAGIASEEFATVNDVLLAHDMIMLAQMKAVKGWVFEDFDRAAVYADHLGIILARLRTAQK